MARQPLGFPPHICSAGPSGTHSPPAHRHGRHSGSESCKHRDSSEALLLRYTPEQAPVTHPASFQKVANTQEIVPLTSADMPKTGAADLCLGLKTHSSAGRQEVDTNSAPSVLSWAPPAVLAQELTVRLSPINSCTSADSPLGISEPPRLPHTLPRSTLQIPRSLPAARSEPPAPHLTPASSEDLRAPQHFPAEQPIHSSFTLRGQNAGVAPFPDLPGSTFTCSFIHSFSHSLHHCRTTTCSVFLLPILPPPQPTKSLNCFFRYPQDSELDTSPSLKVTRVRAILLPSPRPT